MTVDDAVSKFTKELLGMAVKEGVEFKYIGPQKTKHDEVIKVLRENVNVADRLMKKEK